MQKTLALVRQGRICLVGPTSLPDGTVLEVFTEVDPKVEADAATQLVNIEFQRSIDEAIERASPPRF